MVTGEPDAPIRHTWNEVTVRSRRVVVLEPGTIPKTPSGKLRRATSHALLG
jgi:fatty-acyl-CoA synthase